MEYLNAFLCGGLICAIGQILIDKTQLTPARILTGYVVTGVALSALGLYEPLVKWGGAGAPVPITGFANSVAAPAIEYKAEGHVYGIGCKIFTIAGPVILYGTFTSWILGLIYYMIR